MAGGTFDDSKINIAPAAKYGTRNLADRCHGGRAIGELAAKSVERPSIPLDLDVNGT
jgi:hypothetical protein